MQQWQEDLKRLERFEFNDKPSYLAWKAGRLTILKDQVQVVAFHKRLMRETRGLEQADNQSSREAARKVGRRLMEMLPKAKRKAARLYNEERAAAAAVPAYQVGRGTGTGMEAARSTTSR